MGNSTDVNITITNNGSKALSSIDYTVTSDDVVSDAFRVNLQKPIVFGENVTVTVSVPTEGVQCVKTKTITITKVNGETNKSTKNKSQVVVYSLSEFNNRNVVVEEFTGTGTGWSPRGLVGMKNLRETFGDRFIGISIHQYNSSDAMYISISSYAPFSFSGAPACRIDRGEQIDPYYGTYNDISSDFSDALQIPALGTVDVNGMFDEDFTKVYATANANVLFDGTYSLEFVLVADGLNGTESARYILDGRQFSIPQHGINIFRMGDGSVRKVMVK